MEKFCDKHDRRILLANLLIIILTISSIWCNFLAYIGTALIYLYLLVLLFLAAFLSSKEGKNHSCKDTLQNFFPTRMSGLILFLFYFGATAFMFSNLYLKLGIELYPNLCNRLNALCLSVGTITTVSIVNYAPTKDGVKYVMLYQQTGDVLLFLAAFPLLLSRFSTFD